jgi:hypothetical protein
MKSRRAPAQDGSGASRHKILSKERLDDWLDDALADTFPASDPVASPPRADALVPRGDLPTPVESGAPTQRRSGH